MLTTKLTNAELIGALASCGHGDKILITDGNYPVNTAVNENTKVIDLGIGPDLPTVTAVLDGLLEICNFEKAEVMVPEDKNEPTPSIFGAFEKQLDGLGLTKLGRHDFYDACVADPNLKIAVHTGEGRLFGNLLLTIAPATTAK